MHSGTLSKTEALKMAKAARAEGIKGVRVLKANPNRAAGAASIPRNKWVNAKIRVTSSGKIQAKVASSSLKKNPTIKKKRKRATIKKRKR